MHSNDRLLISLEFTITVKPKLSEDNSRYTPGDVTFRVDFVDYDEGRLEITPSNAGPMIYNKEVEHNVTFSVRTKHSNFGEGGTNVKKLTFEFDVTWAIKTNCDRPHGCPVMDPRSENRNKDNPKLFFEPSKKVLKEQFCRNGRCDKELKS